MASEMKLRPIGLSATARLGLQRYVVYRGPSTSGVPIKVVLSNLKIPSVNGKTGPMVQASVYVDNGIHVWENQKSGADSAVCNDCPLRPIKARHCPECGHTNKVRFGLKHCAQCGADSLSCYVVTHQSERSKDVASSAEPIDLDGCVATIVDRDLC